MSEGVAALIEEQGFEGYGRWMRLLEIVALKMDKTDRCHVEYPIPVWCSLLKLKRNKLNLFLELIQNKLRTKVTKTEDVIRIEIPNLLKKRDEYSRKSGQNQEHVRSIDTDKDKRRKIKIKDKDKDCPVTSKVTRPTTPDIPIDPDILRILNRCEKIYHLSENGNGKFWKGVLDTIEPYKLGYEWLNKELMALNRWMIAKNKRSPTVKGAQRRVSYWINKALNEIEVKL
jgi:hypothetical protein